MPPFTLSFALGSDHKVTLLISIFLLHHYFFCSIFRLLHFLLFRCDGCLIGLLITADVCSIGIPHLAYPYNTTHLVVDLTVYQYNIIERYAREWREMKMSALVFPVMVMGVQAIGNTHTCSYSHTHAHTHAHAHTHTHTRTHTMQPV